MFNLRADLFCGFENTRNLYDLLWSPLSIVNWYKFNIPWGLELPWWARHSQWTDAACERWCPQWCGSALRSWCAVRWWKFRASQRFLWRWSSPWSRSQPEPAARILRLGTWISPSLPWRQRNVSCYHKALTIVTKRMNLRMVLSRDINRTAYARFRTANLTSNNIHHSSLC